MMSQKISAEDRAVDGRQREVPIKPVGPAGSRREGEGNCAFPPTRNWLATSSMKGNSGRSRGQMRKNTVKTKVKTKKRDGKEEKKEALQFLPLEFSWDVV